MLFRSKKEDGKNILVAQGQVWVTTKDEGILYYTSIQTIPIEYGERVFFFPLGQKKDDQRARIEVQLVLSPYVEGDLTRKTTPPKADQPKVEPPKQEKPAAAPKTDQSKAETPKQERVPTVQKAEPPKAAQAAALLKIDTPKNEMTKGEQIKPNQTESVTAAEVEKQADE